YPRQNQESRVVDDQANVPASRLGAPTDVAVARTDMPRRARPRQTGDRPTLRPHQILQVLSHRLFVTQIMMLLHQAVKQRLVHATPHLHKLQGLDLFQTAFDGRRVEYDWSRPDSPRQRVVWNELHRRQ